MLGEDVGEKMELPFPAFSLFMLLWSCCDPVAAFQEEMAQKLSVGSCQKCSCLSPLYSAFIKDQEYLHVKKPLFFLLHLPYRSGDLTQGLTHAGQVFCC